MTDQRVHWLQIGDGNVVIGGGLVQGAEAISVTLAVPGRVQVTADVAAQLRTGGLWVWNGAALIAAPVPALTNDDRMRGLGQADNWAEAKRRDYVTAGAGQAMEYLLTLDEARAYLAATTPAAIDFPLLAGELAAITACGKASDMASVARAVMAADKATRVALATIKTKRRIAKIVVRAAVDATSIDAALAAMKA